MKLKYILSFFRTVKMPGLFPIMMDWRGLLRIHFLYSAIESGLLKAVRKPCSRNELMKKLDVKRPEILDALLKVGISIKELQCKNGQYSIRGKRSLAMVGENSDIISAVVQANVTYYNNAYRNAAVRMKGSPLGDDLKKAGDIIARFSKLAEPVMKNFISEIVTDHNTMRVLDIGCGSGIYLKSILSVNPNATGIGIDVDEEAADQAMQNIKVWGLVDRFEIIKGDIRSLPSDINSFDLITLINVVYYFPVEKRVELFRTLRSKLSSEGSLAIVMTMEGKDTDVAAANLNMVNASLEGVTPLPDSSELKNQLIESGFVDVKVTGLMPGSSLIGMHAR